MRYKVNGLEVRSENAAKPGSLAGQWMLDWISKLNPEATGLDLGCGKLRYTIPLAKRISDVTAVDSQEQLNRPQRLLGENCTVREYVARHFTNVRAYAIHEGAWRQKRYSVILCSNVLSAIPCLRTRKGLVKAAYDQLCPGGEFLVTTQYRNSHFTNWKTDPRAKPLLDGFLVEHARGVSFYGLIDSTCLAKLCRRVGFAVTTSGHAKELAYAFATRP